VANKIKTRFLRNKDLVPLQQLNEVSVVGLGGIGSFLIQGLAMMGWHKVIGYDGDVIEDHNLSTTAYPVDETGNAKRDSAQGLFQRYAEDWQEFIPMENFGINDKVTSKMIVCTDDMESRKMVFNKWKETAHEYWAHPEWSRSFFIDLRMGATSVEMVTCTPAHVEVYDKHWVPTHTIPAAPCSMKHTVFATNHIVSLGLAQVYNIVAQLVYYDYIWTSLNPNMVEFGTLIKPVTSKEVSIDTSKESLDRLDSNAIGIDILNHRSA